MPTVHPTAIVSESARLGDGVEVGPYCIIEDHVSIGEGTWIEAHAKVGRHTTLGANNRVFFGAVIGHTSVDLKSHGGACLTQVGDDNIIREYVTISASSDEGDATVIGNRNLLMNWTNIAHDCIIGDRVIMANFATLGGHVEVEGNCRIGAHAAFHQFVRVGRGSMSGACSKFVKDLPPYCVGDGHPAEVRGLNLLGLDTAQNHPMKDVPEASIEQLKHAYRLLYRDNITRQEALRRIREELSSDPHVSHLLAFIDASKRGVS